MNGQEGVARGDAGKPARLPKLWRRGRTKLIALGAGLFICGAFVGSCVTAGAMHHRMVKSLRNPDEIPYNGIDDDESTPINGDEPMAPKPINLVQYQQVKKIASLVDDPDPSSRVEVGLLPRFDKWKFQPI